MLFYRKIAIVRYFEEFIYSEKSVKVFFFLSIFYLLERSLDLPLYFVIQLTFSFKDYIVRKRNLLNVASIFFTLLFPSE